MKGIYQIQVKNTTVDIEVTYFKPFIKGYYYGLHENCYPDDPMEFEWSAVTDNDLLNELIEDFLFEYIDNELRNILEKNHGK